LWIRSIAVAPVHTASGILARIFQLSSAGLIGRKLRHFFAVDEKLEPRQSEKVYHLDFDLLLGGGAVFFDFDLDKSLCF
jgi:hypothetical protein